MSGWTAASLVPPHQVAAAAATATPGVGTQTFTPAQVPQLDTSANVQQILAKILGPNYTLGQNPSPIAGSSSLFSPNYLAQVQQNTAPTPGANGFTRFGNSYWKMPPAQPPNTQTVPGVNETAFAPAATNSGPSKSAWLPTENNLFNI